MFLILSNTSSSHNLNAEIHGSLSEANKNLIPNIFSINSGRKPSGFLSPFNINVIEKFSKAGKLQDKLSVKVHSGDSLFVVSDFLKEILTEYAAGQVEFYGCRLVYGEETITGYNICHLLDRIDCVDDDNSELDYYSEDEDNIDYQIIYSVDMLQLEYSRIPKDQKIFLLKRFKESIPVIAEDLLKVFNEKNVTGINCIPIQDFYL